jgi:hypothetical protein
MNFSQLAASRRPPWRIIFLAASAVCVIATLFFVFVLRLPRRLNPGQVVDQIGTYRFPSGGRQLEIVKTDDGHLEVMTKWPDKRWWPLPTWGRTSVGNFDVERQWFISVDECKRLWLFVGPWDPQWGRPRKLSSGGSASHVPTVLMEGKWFLPDGSVVSGSNDVSMSGDWTGVPAEFFDRIPGKSMPVWGNIPKIPVLPASFTERQMQQLAARAD